jgi:ABC-type iron transport system FetAB permease component
MLSARADLDRLMARILFVDPYEIAVTSPVAERTRAVFGMSLLFSGARCVLQYVVLPFVLPLVGIASDVAVPFMLALSIIAVLSIISSLRRLWAIRYARRWHYFGLATASLFLLAVFIALDIRSLANF